MTKFCESRRSFLQTSFAAGTAAAYFFQDGNLRALEEQSRRSEEVFSETTFSLDSRRVRFYSKAITEPVKILQFSDTHLYLDDERGEKYRDYSGRMAKAYNSTRNYKNNAATNPIEMFNQIIDEANSQDLDAIAMTGDIVSFPSAAGVDFILKRLSKLSTPSYYIAGNHDWHFEGLPGSSRDLRDEWIEKRLKPLYPSGVNPLAYAVKVKGVKLIFVDDSTYEIMPEQLEFIKKELSSMEPAILFMHIPLYAPGRSVGFGVGHPNWNASTDGNYKIERRPQWPAEGHTETTYAFRQEALKAVNVLGVFAGHIHVQSLDICQGKPLLVAPAGIDGSAITIEVLPM